MLSRDRSIFSHEIVGDTDGLPLHHRQPTSAKREVREPRGPGLRVLRALRPRALRLRGVLRVPALDLALDQAVEEGHHPRVLRGGLGHHVLGGGRLRLQDQSNVPLVRVHVPALLHTFSLARAEEGQR